MQIQPQGNWYGPIKVNLGVTTIRRQTKMELNRKQTKVEPAAKKWGQKSQSICTTETAKTASKMFWVSILEQGTERVGWSWIFLIKRRVRVLQHTWERSISRRNKKCSTDSSFSHRNSLHSIRHVPLLKCHA